jgi:hypothetical protein
MRWTRQLTSVRLLSVRLTLRRSEAPTPSFFAARRACVTVPNLAGLVVGRIDREVDSRETESHILG